MIGERSVAAWRGSVEHEAFSAGLTSATAAFRALEIVVPPPRWAPWRDNFNWQYVEKLPQQAILQKLARQISSTLALDVLLDSGLLQECGSMQRMLDEIFEDILFLSVGLTTGNWNHRHDSYLEHFWSEDERIAAVQRKHIRAYVNRAFPMQADPSTADSLGRELYSVFSDFLHARSSPTMAMISGPPPRYHLAGIFDERATRSFREQAPTYGYRCLMSAVAATRAIGNPPLAGAVYDQMIDFETKYSRLVS